MQLKLAFAMIALAAVVAACQEGPEMPTARGPEIDGIGLGEAYRGGSASRSLTPAAITLQASESGLISLTQDGVGFGGTSGTVTLVKTAGTTARRCFFATTVVFFTTIASGEMTIDGAGVTFTQSAPTPTLGGTNYFADVTPLVKPQFDAAAVGNVNYTIGEPAAKTGTINGSVLACVLDDPAQTTQNTAIILFGHQNPAGDTFQITHPVPVVPAGLVFDMSLAIGHSFQPSNQVSIVNVNSQPLTACAGGQDDGVAGNGSLLTAGGTGDTSANPAPTCSGFSGPTVDDELYNLVPFVSAGETTTTIFSQNPTNDDTIFFVTFFLNRAALIGAAQCSDGLDNDDDGLTDFPADPGCTSALDTSETDPVTGGLCPAPPGGGTVITGREFLGVVVFVGTEGDDVAVGVAGRRNIFLMRGGDDYANGANLQDSFFGGLGDDTWCGDAGSDASFGGQGSDTLTGLDGFDRNDGGHTPVPSSSNDLDTDICFGEANFLCEQSAPDGAPVDLVTSSSQF